MKIKKHSTKVYKQVQNDDIATTGNALKDKIREKFMEKVTDFQFYKDDAKNNFMKEIPLSIKIERFQRKMLLQGLKPERNEAQKQSMQYLQSLKFIQRNDEIDDITLKLRKRN